MNLQETRPAALIQAIPDLVSKAGPDTKAHCHFEVVGVPRALSSETDRQLFRICQEAFTNAQRHSEASNIAIVLTFAERSVLLKISDDGRGFSPLQANDMGFGLSGMKKRAERIGALLTIQSNGSDGTTIFLELREPNGIL